MGLEQTICFVAAASALAVGLAAVLRKSKMLASWLFLAGMAVLAAEVVFGAVSLARDEPAAGSVAWLNAAWLAKAALPAVWLCFSLCYARGNSKEFLRRWRVALALALVLPLATAATHWDSLLMPKWRPVGGGTWTAEISSAAEFLTVLLLGATVLILVNIEKTYKAAVGTTRWRVKFLALGVGVVFGTRIYTLSQAILFSTFNPALISIEAAALLVASCLMGIAYTRSGFAELDIYPSRAVLHKSATVIIIGAYLFIVGVFAEAVASLGGTSSFPAQAFVVLLGVTGLAALLLSNRFNLALRRFVGRHFHRPEHDFRTIWARCSRQLSGVVGAEEKCAAASKLISDTFDVLSTSIFLYDPDRAQLALASSTSRTGDSGTATELSIAATEGALDALRELPHPFDLDVAKGSWASRIQDITPIQFTAHAIHRVGIRLMSGGHLIGLLVVADRVSGIPFTSENLELLECIADELAAQLLSSNLTEDLMQARELEAFQAMSAFFVHDMKNAASNLNLTLKNMAVHYDDPEFRKDALRGISKTAERIGKLTDKLSTLRSNLNLQIRDADLNAVVRSALADLDGEPGVELIQELRPVPCVRIDTQRIESVVTNLVINAKEAVAPKGKVAVETSHENGRVRLTVRDDGCGMCEEFVRKSLFRPFHSTKKQGMGIGMFQSKMIVEAHGGRLNVDSEPGQGSTFRVGLPVANVGHQAGNSHSEPTLHS